MPKGGRLDTSAVCALGLALMFGLPYLLDTYGIVEFTVFVVMAILSLSLGFIWGYGGILSFGQSAFFGLGGYAYAVAAMNASDSTLPFLAAIVVPTLFAGLLGYFMFYGRISDTYLGVITLTVTVILFNVFNSTAGDAYHIGNAPLGGFNGMPSVPPLNIPGMPDRQLGPDELWYVAAGFLIVVYAGLKFLLRSHFGRMVVAIRENESRAALLGYDTRRYKLLVFMIGGGIAGLAGCLFTNWGGFISPTVFSLATSAQIIIWVMVGGLSTLIGPIIGCIAIQYLVSSIGAQQVFNANLVLGTILLVFVLLVPQGVIPALLALAQRLRLPWPARDLGPRTAMDAES
jgi:branched-chain amino acid transport system permease protein